MATFAELKAAVLALLVDARTEVASEVSNFVRLALRELQSRHNFLVQKAETTAITVSGQRTLAVRPGDWKEWRDVPYRLSYSGATAWVAFVDGDEARRRYGDSTGAPEAVTETSIPDPTTLAVNLEVWPLPDGKSDWNDGEYRIVLPYWRLLPDLAADTDENWFTRDHQTRMFIVSRAAAEGFRMMWDEARAAIHDQRAEWWFERAQAEDKRRAFGRIETIGIWTGANRGKTRRF